MDWKTIITDLMHAGVSQSEIGRRTGINQACLSRIYSGKQKDVMYGNGVKLLDLYQSEIHQRKKFSSSSNR